MASVIWGITAGEGQVGGAGGGSSRWERHVVRQRDARLEWLNRGDWRGFWGKSTPIMIRNR